MGEKLFDDDGTPLAELDVEVRGKVGSTEMVWLIECRDRPSKGAAPSEWIQSLDGRRRLFGFNKVTAVSTTGFSKSALAAAQKLDIEVRTVKGLSADAFSHWLPMTHFVGVHNQCELTGSRLLIDPQANADVRDALLEAIKSADNDARLLKKSRTGDCVKPAEALLALVEQNDLFSRVEPNGPELRIQINAQYTNDADHFVVETSKGDVRIRAIEFIGLLRAKETIGLHPVSRTPS